MIYFRCPYCPADHPSSFQTSLELMRAQPDTLITDRCPTTDRPVVYRLRNALWVEP